MSYQKLEPGKTFVFVSRGARARMEIYRVRHVSVDNQRVTLEDAQDRNVGVYRRDEVRRVPARSRVFRVPKWEMFEDNPEKLPKEIHERVYRKRMQ